MRKTASLAVKVSTFKAVNIIVARETPHLDLEIAKEVSIVASKKALPKSTIGIVHQNHVTRAWLKISIVLHTVIMKLIHHRTRLVVS